MKFKFFLILTLAFSLQTFAQEWSTDFEEAKKMANNNNQNIALVFQGSDWCAPCIKLEKEIWSTNEFQKLNKDHFVMLKADFPRRKQNQLSEQQQIQNKELAELYNPNGYFPLVVVLDKKGKILGKLGYEKTTPSQYFKKLTSF